MISKVPTNMGPKADNLRKLREAGFRVPWFISFKTDFEGKAPFYYSLDKEIDKKKIYAVRSSVNVEDGIDKSYAGHFHSVIGVDYSKLYNAFVEVKKAYNGQQGGIIVQEFINSEKSGVLFTNDGNNRILINANFGLCKTVVEGQPCDEYVVSRSGKLLSVKVEKAKKALRFSDSSLHNDVNNSPGQVLSKAEIRKLITVGLKIEQIFDNPQDIEWCIRQGKIYILQSRHITRKINSHKNSGIYDSANIAESYSGIVKPLTFSFARDIYKTVYINLLCASGASRRKVMRHVQIFENMLRILMGRMYYNMTNWYLMMAFIPGYKRNKKNLENMISSNLVSEIEKDISPNGLLVVFYPLIVLVKLLVMPVINYRFIRKVENRLKFYRGMSFSDLNWEECINVYYDLDHSLLNKWHIPVENDFMVMTYWGILKKKISEQELQKYVNFDNISVHQIDALAELSSFLQTSPELKEAINNTDARRFDRLLGELPEYQLKLDDYFKQYGGRFANELKLESPDIEEDKSKLLLLLKLYSNFKPPALKQEKILPEGFLLRYVLKKFKKYAARRERMRLLRSNCFSLIRKLFNRMGEIAVEKDVFKNQNDIYYMELQELLTVESPEKITDIQKIINQRKADYKVWDTKEPLPFFKWIDGDDIPLKSSGDSAERLLHGRSCTPGECKGIVKVFPNYFLPEEINFDILVASHTDPGWTPLIGLSKGLIIEYGGVLSHAAIVSRELGIPTVIGLEGATRKLVSGQEVIMSGSTGQVQILKE